MHNMVSCDSRKPDWIIQPELDRIRKQAKKDAEQLKQIEHEEFKQRIHKLSEQRKSQLGPKDFSKTERKRRFGLSCYTTRNDVIRQLGFISYSEYLESVLWASIRKRVLSGGYARCIKCKRQADQVHHSRYDIDTLCGHCLIHLHPVCARCHSRSEYDLNGKKLSLETANQNLLVKSGKARGPKRKTRKKKRNVRAGTQRG